MAELPGARRGTKRKLELSSSELFLKSRLDSLSDEAVLNVVRHFSGKPQSSKWTTSVPVRSLVTLLQIDPRFVNTTRASFLEIILSGKFQYHRRDSSENRR